MELTVLYVLDVRYSRFLCGEECEFGDAANVDVAPHQNVTSLAPCSAPRVSRNPVVGAVGSSVSHQNDAMVNRSIPAGVVVEDA